MKETTSDGTLTQFMEWAKKVQEDVKRIDKMYRKVYFYNKYGECAGWKKVIRDEFKYREFGEGQ